MLLNLPDIHKIYKKGPLNWFMNLNFMGKNVVITGGSRGIGEASARLFSEAEAKVVVLDLEQPKDKNVEFYKCDVSKIEEVRKAAEKIKKVDVLVNNAGIILVNEFLEQDEKDWSKIIDTNVLGVFNCSKIFGEKMKTNGGKIVNVVSTHAFPKKNNDSELGTENAIVYAASKGAIATFTKALALELAKYNINVNGICPTLTKTEMTKEILDEISEEFYKKKLPLNRINEAEDVANAILFLSSEKARNITGQLINVDAGYLLK